MLIDATKISIKILLGILDIWLGMLQHSSYRFSPPFSTGDVLDASVTWRLYTTFPECYFKSLFHLILGRGIG